MRGRTQGSKNASSLSIIILTKFAINNNYFVSLSLRIVSPFPRVATLLAHLSKDLHSAILYLYDFVFNHCKNTLMYIVITVLLKENEKDGNILYVIQQRKPIVTSMESMTFLARMSKVTLKSKNTTVISIYVFMNGYSILTSVFISN